MSTSQELVSEAGPRNSTHGSFERNAQLSQELKSLIYPSIDGSWSFVAREAIDMICLKMSRILSGRIAEPDHWRDIGGYAQLVYNSKDSTYEPASPSFEAVADYSQALKVFIAKNMDPEAAAAASPLQREALDTLCQSVARIMAGGVTQLSNWLYIIEAAEAVTDILVQQQEVETLPSISKMLDAKRPGA